MIVLLCESVVVHESGSFSVIHGGLSSWSEGNFPTVLSTKALVYIPRLTLLKGVYEFRLKVTNILGEPVCALPGGGHLDIADEELPSLAVIGLDIPIPSPGKYLLMATCGPRACSIPLQFSKPVDPSLN